MRKNSKICQIYAILLLLKSQIERRKMFHICFAANEGYIKYTAVLITSIIKSTDTTKKFKDFFDTTRERERESRISLKIA